MGFFSSLFGSNGSNGSASPYASTRDQDKNARRQAREGRRAADRRAGHRRNATRAARAGQAWEDADRRRLG
ncbi:hypothetical protein H1V43_32260 [Streptomyces sp. PSKA54]|uniref:Uncharacterized protein n=1 Tax=Streptomyces himalayensis subsp. aureolus TaxID=2758039 RepID=A0A7W2D6Y8_9ACTN|nr:hypothetical protein [Streptomyces himalayensis]MBA4865939.1 hypothetical protein [Streptomyces himalayensis subsp. aureolus]